MPKDPQGSFSLADSMHNIRTNLVHLHLLSKENHYHKKSPSIQPPSPPSPPQQNQKNQKKGKKKRSYFNTKAASFSWTVSQRNSLSLKPKRQFQFPCQQIPNIDLAEPWFWQFNRVLLFLYNLDGSLGFNRW